MKLLAINTCFKNTYVVAVNENLSSCQQVDSKLKQSENVLEIVDTCLRETNFQISDLDAIACVVGPGSFTGIRIGLALVKGFLFGAKEVKFIPITSFELMLEEIREKGEKAEVCLVLNALSSKLFVQSFDKNNKSTLGPKLVEGEEINSLKNIYTISEDNLTIGSHKIDFSLDGLKNLASKKFENGEFSENLEPIYIRKSQAEDELEKREKKID